VIEHMHRAAVAIWAVDVLMLMALLLAHWAGTP
jgi:hypothetical protein